MKLLILLLLLAVSSFAVTEPTPPQVYVDTTYPTIGHTGHDATIATNDCTAMQTAINAATGDDEIVVTHGLNFTCNFTLPHKTANAWTIIRSDVCGSSIPIGTKVGSANAANLVRFETSTVAPVFDDLDSANYWWIACTEIGIPDSWSLAVVQFGLMFSYQHNGGEQPSNWPTHLVIDRSWIHCSATLNQDCKKGVGFNGVYEAVINSTIEEIHHHYQDSQAISGFCGAGPYKMVNNDLSATGETILFGGADCVNSRTVVPSDMEIKRNHMFKPLKWQPSGTSCGYINPTNSLWDGECWDVKNLLEFKTGQRLLIDGNVFENEWYDAQQVAIVFHSSNQNDGGGSPQAFNGDVTFTNNILKNICSGFTLYGQEVGAASATHNPPEAPPISARIKIANNLVYPLNVDGFRMMTSGYNHQIYTYSPPFNIPTDVQFIHNTLLMKSGYTASGLYASADENFPGTDIGPNWVFKDNILDRPVNYGFGVAGKEGSNCYGGAGMCYLGNLLNPYVWTNNILSNDSGNNAAVAALYPISPATTVVTMHTGVGFINYSDNAADYHDYALTTMSVGHNAASDGTDIGVNFAALDTAINGSSGGSVIGGNVTISGNVTR